MCYSVTVLNPNLVCLFVLRFERSGYLLPATDHAAGGHDRARAG